jgi:probable phosphoglycerate mutase
MSTSFVYLVRHARSHANQENLLIGRVGAHELNEVGHQQAACLAQRLRGEGISALRSSPLRRAVQTAEVIAAAIGRPPSIDDDLIERDFGPFDGMDRPRLLAARAQLGLDNRDPTGYFPAAVPGVEPLGQVQRRMTHAWQAAAQAAVQPDEDRRIGLVSHAGTIKALLYGALGIPEHHPRAFKVFQASYVKCKVAAAGHLTVHEIWVNPVQ